MPSPSPPSKRERIARFISRLRSKRTSGSSLVVQTGFPTSLADLVVKNRAKFRKRKKPSHSPDLDSAAPVAVRSESDGSGDGRAPAVEIPNRIDEGIEALPVSARVRMRRRRVGLGLGFFMVKVAALVVVLAVGRKWVVAGITVLTFVLLALELCGLVRPRSQEGNVIERFDLGGRGLVSPIREEVEDYQNSESLDPRSDFLLERRDFDALLNNNKDRDSLRPRSSKRNFLETGTEVFHLRGRELVSPIREIEPGNHQNASKSQRISDILVQSKGNLGNSEVSSSRSDTSLECKALDATESIINSQDVGNSRKSRRKKFFRKLFKRQKREKRDEKELSSSLDDSRVFNEVLIEEEEGSNGDDIKENSDEEYFSFELCDEITEVDREDGNVTRDNGDEIRLWRQRKMVFVIVVLLGLLGGKGSALALTVAWYLLSGCTGNNVWKKWKMQ